MSMELAQAHLKQFGRDGDIIVPKVSTATVEEAASALGVIPARIAKSLAVYDATKEGALLVVVAGDAKLDNRKFKDRFGFKPYMLKGEDTQRLTGHAPGGVCPFGVPKGTPVYLDDSMKRFESVFPACGTSNSAIELTLPHLEEYSLSLGWVDVCKDL